jgi:hypothetical protein
VTAVRALDGTQAAQRTGAVPASASGGPTATQTSNGTVINGGSDQIRLTSTTPFQTVLASASTSSATASGYWELRLPAATTSATVIPTFARSLPSSGFNLTVTVGSAAGIFGTPLLIPLRVAAASTGDVQVSATWDTATDVDLHVVEPSGAEIYYGSPSSATGGLLDLDSNAACGIDNVNNENIRWPSGRAPSGTYTVRLDYWSSCGIASTNYVVTVNNGGNTQTFTGTFTGTGDAGSAGSGRLITSFTRSGTSLTAPSSAQSERLRPENLIKMMKKTALSAAAPRPQ